MKDGDDSPGCWLYLVFVAIMCILSFVFTNSREESIRQAVMEAEDYYTVEYQCMIDSASTQIEDCKSLLEEALNTGDFGLVEDALNTLEEIDLDYDNI